MGFLQAAHVHVDMLIPLSAFFAHLHIRPCAASCEVYSGALDQDSPHSQGQTVHKIQPNDLGLYKVEPPLDWNLPSSREATRSYGSVSYVLVSLLHPLKPVPQVGSRYKPAVKIKDSGMSFPTC